MDPMPPGAGDDPATAAPAEETPRRQPAAPAPPAPPRPVAPPAAAAPRRRSPIISLSRLFNPLVLTLSGTPFLPLYGVITHHGRRSGTAYRTPVVVRPTRDGFVVPLPWGETTDWYRNVRAAGGCVIRWKGRDYPMDQPELISDPAAVRASFSGFERAAMSRFGIKQVLRLRHRRSPQG